VVKINLQGVCNYLTKEGWNERIGDEFLSTFNPWAREPDPPPALTRKEEE